MSEKLKREVEILLTRLELTASTDRKTRKTRHLVCADLIWPRKSIAKKSAAREAVIRKGEVDFSSEEWAKRILFREEIDSHSAIAVSVTESVTVQKIKRFARLTAKYALRMGADFVEKTMVGYADIASAPIDALSAMVGEKDAPEAIAQGVVDIVRLPSDGEEICLDIPLRRPGGGKIIGTFSLVLRG